MGVVNSSPELTECSCCADGEGAQSGRIRRRGRNMPGRRPCGGVKSGAIAIAISIHRRECVIRDLVCLGAIVVASIVTVVRVIVSGRWELVGPHTG
eukprot:scaffold85732_cov34-Attheya_sp.AAC.1